ncbi:MAG: tRNA (guanine-N7-)-methyltransferase [Enterobacterales bacterium]|jgi:tRNA (guanine-N7-)-methyltransferase
MKSSRIITSNQLGIHPELEAIVKKHIQQPFQKPISELNLLAFDKANEIYKKHQHNFILDSGCGVGESTYQLATKFPDAFVLGVDQSEHRLQSNNQWTLPDNAFLIQANLIDFWRLAVNSGWNVKRHYLLYPNPWPKKKHLQRRWHGHPIFPILKELGGTLELRTNWLIYAEEFKVALSLLLDKELLEKEHLGKKLLGKEFVDVGFLSKQCQLSAYSPTSAITPFERKYQLSGQELYQLLISFAN